ncbi:disease resistance protein RPS2 [Diospyros lotus]|uniref:disease resistance protein RPS2 n=1 Tax=Diospyros lotus TaxID=55363 RepID=UPI0022509D25|nr:disease resistance protein RPS2 [Diospyros lotus]XP_052180846.1 disease resistance protein RPS2 [Diospyros lotus]XP_052180847.1 disease resistance protein RPS2 [Diospyros lotus]XP_052180848.1 disease resistance protein RPS2 [Diospyros lotus]
MDLMAPVIKDVISLGKYFVGKISHFVNLDGSVRSLRIALEEAKAVRNDLERRIYLAELEGLTRTNQVRKWLERFDAIEAEISLIIQDFGRPTRCFWCSTASFASRYKLGKKVSMQLKEINKLRGKGALDVIVADGSLPPTVEEMPTRPAIGLESMLEKARQFLREDDAGVMGIYGMGGAGKTTLLKYINNELLTLNHDFDLVIWIVVSKDVIAEKIQEAIVVRLGMSWDETEHPEQIASKIYKVMRKKRFLLLLDDVWEGIVLENIGIPLPNKQNKCKAIFTTRSVDVCSDMDAQCKLKVEFLKEKESRQLFYEKVGRIGILSSPSIQSHAEAIIRKCGGLPLALITTGRAMANKETEEEWKYAIEVLNKSPSELRGMGDVFNLLKFSYDNLDNDILRSCLLYCSLFSEDYSIEKGQLIEYWIGEGILDSSHGDNVHNMGHALIGSLKGACLLETGEVHTQVKMHDVVRSFALWIASDPENRFIVQASLGLTVVPSVENWEAAHRISLLDNGITELLGIPFCPHLSTLLLQWNSCLNKISYEVFQSMPVLRVLDLSFTSLRYIPASICQLAELHYLDLSGTKLSTLPKELGFLTKLRHLDLQRTRYLRTIPREAISGLSQLRVLNLYYSYGGWEMQECEGNIEVRLGDLDCLRHLTSIGITVTELVTLKKLSAFNSLLKCIQYLYIKECEGLSYLQLSSFPSDGERLRRLSINNCCDLKHLEIGLGPGKNWLPSLEVLALYGLPNLTAIWTNPVSQGCLRSLRSINIWYCDKLKNVSWILGLPKLEMIYLFYCQEMEEVISGQGESEAGPEAFPCLRIISIRDLPELESISQRAVDFPSLEKIAVSGCAKLKKLPLRASNPSTLPTVYGDKEWWDNLEWDEDATNPLLLPRFMAI